MFGWALQLHFPYGHVLRTLALTEVACVPAALVPARQAAALEPAEALRYE